MSHIHSKDTKPEVSLRRKLWRLGFRYLTNDRRFPGVPDIVLPKYRTVIFIHGCFWHGHVGCKRFVMPKSNQGYWEPKIAKNRNRDQEVWRSLEAKGWQVIIVWECELSHKSIDATVEKTASQLRSNYNSLISDKLNRKIMNKEMAEERSERKKRYKHIREELTRKYEVKG